MSFFDSVTLLPADPIFHLQIDFNADARKQKVNLGIGSYKDSEGHSLLLTSVKDAEKALVAREKNKDYLPIDGYQPFIQGIGNLVFAPKYLETYSGGSYGVQAAGGTAALRTGGDFLVQETSKILYIPAQSWPNHRLLFTRCGLQVNTYRCYDSAKRTFDFEGMCDDIRNMPAGSTILLQAQCHNPTGLDPTEKQWKELSDLIKKQKLIPYFDAAYQGFGKSIDDDVKAVRYFASQGHEMLVAYSCSKNFGLYNERVGALFVLSQSKVNIKKVESQIKQIIRTSYSNPPAHGAYIVAEILQSDSLKKDWMEELDNMRGRLNLMRETFVSGLQVKARDRDWTFLSRQVGFFAYFAMSPEEVSQLTKEYALYLPGDGRINIAGLNSYNLDIIIDAIANVIHP